MSAAKKMLLRKLIAIPELNNFLLLNKVPAKKRSRLCVDGVTRYNGVVEISNIGYVDSGLGAAAFLC
jgi:hypothetical protein